MRPFLLAAFGLQVIFGTSCMMQTVSAQDLPPEPMMTVAPVSALSPHAACAQKKSGNPVERTAGDTPCSGHCLSQATNRAVSDSTVQVPGTSTIASTFAFSTLTTLTEAAPCSSTLLCALSPPPTQTVVLRL